MLKRSVFSVESDLKGVDSTLWSFRIQKSIYVFQPTLTDTSWVVKTPQTTSSKMMVQLNLFNSFSINWTLYNCISFSWVYVTAGVD